MFVSRHGKERALIKLLYHSHLQAISQQKHIEGECFHKHVSQRSHTISMTSKPMAMVTQGGISRKPSAELENITDVKGRVAITPKGDRVVFACYKVNLDIASAFHL